MKKSTRTQMDGSTLCELKANMKHNCVDVSKYMDIKVVKKRELTRETNIKQSIKKAAENITHLTRS